MDVLTFIRVLVVHILCITTFIDIFCVWVFKGGLFNFFYYVIVGPKITSSID